MLFPTRMGIELISGFDSQLIMPFRLSHLGMSVCPQSISNVPAFADAETDFDDSQGSLKRLIAVASSLRAILSLTFIPIVNDIFRRRGSVDHGWFRDHGHRSAHPRFLAARSVQTPSRASYPLTLALVGMYIVMCMIPRV